MKTLNALFLLAVLPLFFWSCGDDGMGDIYNGCCDTLDVELPVGDGSVYIPNSFSPNGDGINDVFHPFASNEIEIIELFRILDVSGEVLFENENFQPNNPSGGWANAEDHPGRFNYELRALAVSGEVATKKGSACSFNCKTGTVTELIGDVSKCVFGVQHNGAGKYDPSFPPLETSDCF